MKFPIFIFQLQEMVRKYPYFQFRKNTPNLELYSRNKGRWEKSLSVQNIVASHNGFRTNIPDQESKI